MNYNDLKLLIDSKNLEVQAVATEIGMGYDGFRLSVQKETIQLQKLKKLCELLKINPMLFFENMQGQFIDGGTTQMSIWDKKLFESKDREIELLKQQIQDKTEIIKLLREKNNKTGYGMVADNH